MVMHYFWGLAVGHTDTQGHASATVTPNGNLDAAAITEPYDELNRSSEQLLPLVFGDPGGMEHSSTYCGHNPKFSLDDHENDDWAKLNSGNEDRRDETDEDTLIELHEMYSDTLYT
jgi:hypothetical protein